MFDKNGRELKDGVVVRIENAYFKSDNGLYYIEHSPGDPDWSGSDYSLRKIRRDGRLSVSKYNITFWPLKSYTNDRTKNALARSWNAENATIEIVEDVPRAEIKSYFECAARSYEENYNYYSHFCGWPPSELETYKRSAEHCANVAANI